MRRYEVVFVLAPTLTEEEFDEQVETYSKVAEEKGAEVIEIDKWGKRRLAFPVKKHGEGYYTVLTLDEDGGEAVAELERRFKVADAVIRFLSVRIDLDLKRAEKFEKRRELRQQRRRQKNVEAAKAEARASRKTSEEEDSTEKEKTEPSTEEEKTSGEPTEETAPESASKSAETGQKKAAEKEASESGDEKETVEKE